MRRRACAGGWDGCEAANLQFPPWSLHKELLDLGLEGRTRSHRRRALGAALFIVCYHGTELGKAHLAQISKSNLEITVARDRKLGAARHEGGGAQGTGSGGSGLLTLGC